MTISKSRREAAFLLLMTFRIDGPPEADSCRRPPAGIGGFRLPGEAARNGKVGVERSQAGGPVQGGGRRAGPASGHGFDIFALTLELGADYDGTVACCALKRSFIVTRN
jgi:hypothetical protein